MARISGVQRDLAVATRPSLIKLESKLRRELDEVLCQEELLWYQKSRAEWIRDGDKNTSFFHLSTIVRRWRNRVSSIRDDDGEWLTDKEAVKNHIVHFFESLFTAESDECSHDLPKNLFPMFREYDWKQMNRAFTADEVRSVIMQMGSLKAPGPDGFQALFFQKNWSLVGPNVCKLVFDIMAGNDLPPNLNDTYLMLIPKVDAPEDAKHFRPISLCNVIYKLITKLVVNRLKPVLPQLVSPTQGSYVPGRQISDNVVIFQEVIHSMRSKQGRTSFMAIKIDLEKAYDRLKWSFIHDTLLEMRIPKKFIDIIMKCVSSSSMRVLWNGEPTHSFSPSRGIRQGDPLSPYLFVMCMERLNQLIEEAIFHEEWRPISASKKGPLLSNLFFADDIVLFAEASIDQANVIKKCLDRFCDASGEKVSFSKSRVFFSANAPHELQDDICAALDISKTEELGFYLGMPALHSRVTKATFSHLCEKVDRKLMGWKSKFLSLAGRATLIQSTLSTMALYSFQTAKIPKGTCDAIDKKSRQFLWGATDDTRKVHLISWDQVLKPKSQGGLGLRSMRQANAAFLTKLGWRVLTEPNSLWARVLREKYCQGRCDVDMFQKKQKASNLWQGIVENASHIRQGVQVAIGNGRKTLFWDHSWVTNQPLVDLATKDVPMELLGATVCEMWDQTLGWKWDNFSEYLPISILKLIESHEVVNDDSLDDQFFWAGAGTGSFSIKSAFAIIRNEITLQDDAKWDILWANPAPNRHKFFLWLAMHNRVMCNEVRAKRMLTEDASCPLCNHPCESLMHTIRDCPRARVIWQALCPGSRVNTFFVINDIPSWICDNLTLLHPHQSDNWLLLFSLTVWWIWKWRNYVVFDRNDDIPDNRVEFLRLKLKEVEHALHRDFLHDISIIKKHESLVMWKSPSYQWVALNTDGAAKGCPGLAGGGGIVRTHAGQCVGYFSLNFGVCTAMKAELLALLRGLQLVWEMGFKFVDVRMDSLSCTQIFKMPRDYGGANLQIIKQCFELLYRPQWKVVISHCYREANQAADWLANRGLMYAETIKHPSSLPHELAELVNNDLAGVAWPRLVNM